MTSPPKSNINVILGTMTIGEAGREIARITTAADAAALLSAFRSRGHARLDTARIYGGGTTERLLGAALSATSSSDLDDTRGFVIATKVYPTAGKGLGWMAGVEEPEYTHRTRDVRLCLARSLDALGAEAVDTLYLHAPDRATPVEETLEAVDALVREGRVRALGLSNFQAWEVARVCEICERRGWVRPSVYQGCYNALQRGVEAELVGCLRAYGVAFAVYNPLAGGMLTGRYRRDGGKEGEGEGVEEGARFDAKRRQGRIMRARYWNDASFAALEVLGPVVKRYGISEAEAALRWLAHHSVLRQELGDAIIVGASSKKHLEENLDALEKGPLPEEVVQAFDKGWEFTRQVPLPYWH